MTWQFYPFTLTVYRKRTAGDAVRAKPHGEQAVPAKIAVLYPPAGRIAGFLPFLPINRLL
jgi:hypothetical protein